MPKKNLVIACLFSVSVGFGAENIPKNAVPAPMAVFNFDRDALGKPPAGFTAAITGVGPDIHWEVRQDHLAPSSPNVLVQNGKAPSGDNFALLLLNDVSIDHGEVAVRFKILAGEEAQSAGIVFRYQDPQNYYVITAGAGDEACALYRVKKGKVKQLDTQDAIVSPYTWHELRITFAKGNYTALIDKELALGGKDTSFIGPGSVGLWTALDSSVAFDDFRVAQ